MIKRFRGCSAGPSLKMLPTFLWRRIFTFNIDDVLEDAYAGAGALQSAVSHNYTDPYMESTDLSVLPIVHLHGWVRRPDNGLVFSHFEYARQMHGINPWMTVLSQYIPSEPFIIAGTVLDEIDLEYYLASRSNQTVRADRPPSFWVVPDPDAITRSECERHGLQLFEGTFEQFLNALDKAVPGRVQATELLEPSIQKLFPVDFPAHDVLAFSADFELVPKSVTSTSRGNRFLFGLQPSWDDLASQIDIGRRATRIIAREVASRLKEPARDDRILALLDGVGTGKSTVLRRIAFDMAQSGQATVLTNTALSRLDPNTTIRALNAINGPALVVVDNLAEHVYPLAQVVSRLTKRDIVFLCAEREYRKSYIKQALSSLEWHEMPRLRLDDAEAAQLIEVYRHAGLLAAADAAERPFRNAIVAEPIAIASCRILEDFRPLNRIIDSILSASTEDDKARYLVTAIGYYCFGGGVRYEVLTAICGRNGIEAQLNGPHPLPLAFYDSSDREFIIPLSGTISAQVLNRTDPIMLLPQFVALGNGIASRVNRVGITRRAPEARLANRLFDYDAVIATFLHEKAADFYDGTKNAWQWNSRYWEQVALLNLATFFANPDSQHGVAALELAVQHARHAVAVEHHHFTLTTLGKVLLAHMWATGEGRRDLYSEAFRRLTEAIRMEQALGRNSPQAFVSLFRGTIQFLSLGEVLSVYQLQVLRGLTREAETRFRHDEEVQTVILNLTALLRDNSY